LAQKTILKLDPRHRLAVDPLVIGNENPVLASGFLEENVIASGSGESVDDTNDVPAEAN
jgi:hypothetical protein